jgi:hypothetical protein
LFENSDGKGDKKGGSGDKNGVFSGFVGIWRQRRLKNFKPGYTCYPPSGRSVNPVYS